MSKICRMCGYEAKDRQNFCPGCGSSLTDAIRPEVTQPMIENAGDPRSVETPARDGGNRAAPDTRDLPINNTDVVTPDKLMIQPGISVLLSVFIFGGLAQILNGQVGKGLLILALQLILAVITQGITLLPGVIMISIDAYICAQALKDGRTIGKWSFFGR